MSKLLNTMFTVGVYQEPPHRRSSALLQPHSLQMQANVMLLSLGRRPQQLAQAETSEGNTCVIYTDRLVLKYPGYLLDCFYPNFSLSFPTSLLLLLDSSNFLICLFCLSVHHLLPLCLEIVSVKAVASREDIVQALAFM